MPPLNPPDPENDLNYSNLPSVRKKLFPTPASKPPPTPAFSPHTRFFRHTPLKTPRPSFTPLRRTSNAIATNPGKWRQRQEHDLICWLNYELCGDWTHSEDVGQSVVFLTQLRDMTELYREVNIQNVLRGVGEKVFGGGIYVMNSIKLKTFVRERDLIVEILLHNYHSHWLLLGLSVVLGVNLAQNLDKALKKQHAKYAGANFDREQTLMSVLERAIFENFLKDGVSRDIHTTKGGKNQRISPKTLEDRRYNALILHRLLCLIYLLDRAKVNTPLQPDTPLFRINSQVSASRDVVNLIQGALLKDQADVVRFLALRGYKLNYSTPVFESVGDMRVKNLKEDLRDGVRLTKLASVLTGDKALLEQLQRTTRGMKAKNIRMVHLKNVHLALNTIKSTLSQTQKFSWLASPDHIVAGNVDKTVELIWQIVAIWTEAIVLDGKQLQEELDKVKQQYRDVKNAAPPSFLSEDILTPMKDSPSKLQIFEDCGSRRGETLLKWAATICGMYGVSVREFTEDFSDGAALCLILHHYCPEMLPMDQIGRIPRAERLSSLASESEMAVVEKNLELFMGRCRMLGTIPHIPLSAKATLAPSFQGSMKERCVGRVMQLLVSYLFRRMMNEKRKYHFTGVVKDLMDSHRDEFFEIEEEVVEEHIEGTPRGASRDSNEGLAVALEATVRKAGSGKRTRSLKPTPPSLNLVAIPGHTTNVENEATFKDAIPTRGLVQNLSRVLRAEDHNDRKESAMSIQSAFPELVARQQGDVLKSVPVATPSETITELVVASPVKAKPSPAASPARVDEDHGNAMVIVSGLLEQLTNFVPRLRGHFFEADEYSKRMIAHEKQQAESSASQLIQNAVRNNLARTQASNIQTQKNTLRSLMITCASEAAKKAIEIAENNRRQFAKTMQLALESAFTAAQNAYEHETERTYKLRLEEAEKRTERNAMWAGRQQNLRSQAEIGRHDYELGLLQLNTQARQLDNEYGGEDNNDDDPDNDDFTILAEELADAVRRGEERERTLEQTVDQLLAEKERALRFERDVRELRSNEQEAESALNDKLDAMQLLDQQMEAAMHQDLEELRARDQVVEATIQKNAEKRAAVTIQTALRGITALVEMAKLEEEHTKLRNLWSSLASETAKKAMHINERKELVKSWEEALEIALSAAESAYHDKMCALTDTHRAEEEERMTRIVEHNAILENLLHEEDIDLEIYNDDLLELGLETQRLERICGDNKEEQKESDYSSFNVVLDSVAQSAKDDAEIESAYEGRLAHIGTEQFRTTSFLVEYEEFLSYEREIESELDLEIEGLELGEEEMESALDALREEWNLQEQELRQNQEQLELHERQADLDRKEEELRFKEEEELTIRKKQEATEKLLREQEEAIKKQEAEELRRLEGEAEAEAVRKREAEEKRIREELAEELRLREAEAEETRQREAEQARLALEFERKREAEEQRLLQLELEAAKQIEAEDLRRREEEAETERKRQAEDIRKKREAEEILHREEEELRLLELEATAREQEAEDMSLREFEARATEERRAEELRMLEEQEDEEQLLLEFEMSQLREDQAEALLLEELDVHGTKDLSAGELSSHAAAIEVIMDRSMEEWETPMSNDDDFVSVSDQVYAEMRPSIDHEGKSNKGGFSTEGSEDDCRDFGALDTLANLALEDAESSADMHSSDGDEEVGSRQPSVKFDVSPQSLLEEPDIIVVTPRHSSRIGVLTSKLNEFNIQASTESMDAIIKTPSSVEKLQSVMRRISIAANTPPSLMEGEEEQPFVAEDQQQYDDIIRVVFIVIRQCSRSQRQVELTRLGINIIRDIIKVQNRVSDVIAVKECIDVMTTCVQYHRDFEDIFSAAMEVLWLMASCDEGEYLLMSNRDCVKRLIGVKRFIDDQVARERRHADRIREARLIIQLTKEKGRNGSLGAALAEAKRQTRVRSEQKVKACYRMLDEILDVVG